MARPVPTRAATMPSLTHTTRSAVYRRANEAIEAERHTLKPKPKPKPRPKPQYQKPTKANARRRASDALVLPRARSVAIDRQTGDYVPLDKPMKLLALAKLLLPLGAAQAQMPYTAVEHGAETYTKDANGRWWLGAPKDGNEVCHPRLLKKLGRLTRKKRSYGGKRRWFFRTSKMISARARHLLELKKAKDKAQATSRDARSGKDSNPEGSRIRQFFGGLAKRFSRRGS